MGNTSYKHVMIVGAGGNLGKQILPALLADSSFHCTILTRTNSSSTFPSNAKVVRADYSDRAALAKALKGQDVVISTVGGEALATNFDSALVEAAIEAGVKWFIPSEFSSDTSHPFYASVPFIASKTATNNLLKSNQSKIAHTLITTGPFLDWCFDTGFSGFDINHQTVTLYDEGKEKFSGTSLPTIGKAIIAILKHPQLTQNKRVYLADGTFTQLEVLKAFEKHSGTTWTVKQASTKESFRQGEMALQKGDIWPAIQGYLMAVVYNGQGACIFEGKTSNEELGVATVPMEQLVKEALERKKTASS